MGTSIYNAEAIPPFPHTSKWRGAELSTGTNLPYFYLTFISFSLPTKHENTSFRLEHSGIPLPEVLPGPFYNSLCSKVDLTLWKRWGEAQAEQYKVLRT
jgi:hypothetical protein